ncbi:hypothetical protein EJ04DRAFT_351961 [Polyplosphaeria fusca]|uniref:Uncharacterized protein n=1 Tax=Polyplosphaeria fusca TaxID=682080 RepID=A0A9P4V187_9PLEO|nr:hypothetical protein EJ04DRAFT_351961 [Polyplosphaeria fusca]
MTPRDPERRKAQKPTLHQRVTRMTSTVVQSAHLSHFQLNAPPPFRLLGPKEIGKGGRRKVKTLVIDQHYFRPTHIPQRQPQTGPADTATSGSRGYNQQAGPRDTTESGSKGYSQNVCPRKQPERAGELTEGGTERRMSNHSQHVRQSRRTWPALRCILDCARAESRDRPGKPRVGGEQTGRAEKGNADPDTCTEKRRDGKALGNRHTLGDTTVFSLRKNKMKGVVRSRLL